LVNKAEQQTFLSRNIGYLKEEFSCTEHSRSVSVPCLLEFFCVGNTGSWKNTTKKFKITKRRFYLIKNCRGFILNFKIEILLEILWNNDNKLLSNYNVNVSFRLTHKISSLSLIAFFHFLSNFKSIFFFSVPSSSSQTL
jgi:hypothetical protein